VVGDKNMNIEQNKKLELESPHDMMLAEHSEDVMMSWKTLEFEMFERDKKWYMMILGILILIVAYAIFTNSLIMAITFILIGVLGYIYINKEPRELDFMLTKDGVVVGKEIYSFRNLKSFWIFYEPEIRVISIHTQSYLNPYLHIPLADEDPKKVREILSKYIAEEKHEPGMLEILDRFLKL
jgi:hypothetical protein